MGDAVVKYLSEITRVEWIAYRQIEVTETTDKEPRFLRGLYRSPSDAKQAGIDFDLFIKSARASQQFDNEKK